VNNSNPTNGWHTYEMQWTPNTISFSIDGHEVRHVDADDHEAVSLLHKAQELRMNFWTPTFPTWSTGLNSKDMPWYLLVDYVEVYKYDEKTKKFDLNWRDDFNELDPKRWHKLSGTFEGSTSNFSPSNVFTKDGNLVIKMEPSEGHIHEHEEVMHSHYQKGHEQHGVVTTPE